MKSRLLSLCALALLLGAGARPAQAQLGFGVGLNFESLSDVEFSGNVESSIESSNGYHIGIFFDTGFGPLAIRPGVFYRESGTFEYEDPGSNLPRAFDINSIDVPIDLRLRVLPLPLIKPYVLGGPVFSFPSTDEEDAEEAFENLAVSAAVGAGIELSVPVVGIRIMPELRYAFGISGYLKEDAELFGRPVEAAPSANSFQVRLNVAL